ncbi:TlpA family protein disulfide reductase [Candidatus Finniella inopinata]|uniref:TlpA family protein disulfide reductase n=1 Tax=Candidatus Finniella inopinata TaxID=1696036 RepID=A0A4Q7DF96_9PROT|nr:TlpA disulfide reductase family protein [Candidatus Finniella inopinata]RZI45363.1 TlpA family protein disulfide reductase [Candidatus Finniella inopinata]
MFKNKNFWVGIVIALAVMVLYKVTQFNKKPAEISPQENLTLWDLNYVPTKPIIPLEDFDLLLIKVQGDDNEQPVTTKFSSFKGQPVILHFWATWCGPCVAELPSYNQFGKTSNIVNIAVCVDKTPPSQVRLFCKSKGIDNLKVAVDQNSILANRFGAKALPTSIFINAQGQEIGRITGMVTWENKAAANLIEKHLVGGAIR